MTGPVHVARNAAADCCSEARFTTSSSQVICQQQRGLCGPRTVCRISSTGEKKKANKFFARVEKLCGSRRAVPFARLHVSGLVSLPVYAIGDPRYEKRAVAKYQDLIAGEDGLLATTGTAWKLGDRISGDQILAAELLVGEPARLRSHLFAQLDPQLAARIRAGDFVVAGSDFGVDATHRTIVLALKAVGVAAVIARSFGRFFLRNAIHAGLPALVVEETAAIKTGDRLRVDVEAHVVANRNSGDRYVIRNVDDETLAILRAGGR